MNRSERARLGRETVEILEAGGYAAPGGRWIALADAIEPGRGATRGYPPDQTVPLPSIGARATSIAVANESTLEAARRLVSAGRDVCALNFASAYHPGGGFLSGAAAQEESLARASTLYASLRDQPMYAHHEAHRDPMYTSYAIHSPEVVVFRDDGGALLDEPWSCAFITSAAVNAKVVRERDPSREGAILEAMRVRVERVLAIAATHGHDALVLGAWGCGVFGNRGEDVAGLFGDALEGPFRGVFEQIVFAILDMSAERRFIGPFERRFA